MPCSKVIVLVIVNCVVTVLVIVYSVVTGSWGTVVSLATQQQDQ